MKKEEEKSFIIFRFQHFIHGVWKRIFEYIDAVIAKIFCKVMQKKANISKIYYIFNFSVHFLALYHHSINVCV